ncbi:glycosyltransferase family 4 protein [Acetobacter peroxydans]|uniref:Glycosyl transferase n=1 Tax=Acetobacter peroxydans TaxID=104098 RepID=A0A4Y3TXH2_9PROT|nr:glycosyltransferase family 4 protein [Acetobacter peroxydans]NHO15948.1 glycosyltransferase [Acetobacter peroxydans]GBR36884.1 glycosyltransferase [Acetobacter peroxydans NBRC 13755]GBR43931.1 glycosyltransferase [Acetobacter peroxydans]GEB86464.1 glycosyl transferase [Acetobacter peroxydans]
MTHPPASPVILQVLPALDQGGVERGTIEMAEAITLAGAQALVVSAGGRLESRLRHAGGTHIPLPRAGSRSPLHILRNARALEQIIRAHGVALVHARSRAPAWAARLACRRAGVPFVTTWHGDHAARFGLKKLYNTVLASGDRVIAISAHIARRLAEEYHVGRDRLRIIPRGADIRQFSPDSVSGQRVHDLAEQWRVPPDAPVILMPGRLTSWKGQALVLEALGQIAARRPDLAWCCVLIGSDSRSGRYAHALSEQAARAGLTERIRFTGHCDDMPAAMAMACIVLAPSLRPEPFGRVVVEAQAMAKPVIVARHGGAIETVQDGETGLAVTPGSATELTDAIETVLDSSEEARAFMGNKARQAVLAHYTTQAMQYATLAVYDELLGTALATHFSAALTLETQS